VNSPLVCREDMGTSDGDVDGCWMCSVSRSPYERGNACPPTSEQSNPAAQASPVREGVSRSSARAERIVVTEAKLQTKHHSAASGPGGKSPGSGPEVRNTGAA
jgi:hypothetical protein